MGISVTEFDVFYISFDEPKKEEFWANLVNKVPWAKRVDGVKGFDNAHKRCALESETDYLITIDGDNIIDASFFDEEIPENLLDEKSVFSWSSKNHLNGLVYGNGGIKIWPKKTVLNMKTHENAENEKAKIDFCWDLNYIQMNNCYSTTYVNQTPFQAFRAGFREGVKMSLDQGHKVNPTRFEESLHHKNYQRLLIWCSVGADVDNGLWAILGARMGCYLTNLSENFDFTLVRDYDWFVSFWKNEIIPEYQDSNGIKCLISGYKWSEEKILNQIARYGDLLRGGLNMELAELDATQSAFFKKVYVNPPRVGFVVKETDVGI